jgi:hypothetical protein
MCRLVLSCLQELKISNLLLLCALGFCIYVGSYGYTAAINLQKSDVRQLNRTANKYKKEELSIQVTSKKKKCMQAK